MPEVGEDPARRLGADAGDAHQRHHAGRRHRPRASPAPQMLPVSSSSATLSAIGRTDARQLASAGPARTAAPPTPASRAASSQPGGRRGAVGDRAVQLEQVGEQLEPLLQSPRCWASWPAPGPMIGSGTVDAERFLIVLPTYDERDNLPRVVEPIEAVLPALPFAGDVLVVDDVVAGRHRRDGGRAGRRAAVDARAPPAPQGGARPRRTSPASGGRWSATTRTCWRWTATSRTRPLRCRPCSSASRHADLVLGSRYVAGGGVEGWPASRRVISRGGCLYARPVLGVGVHDLTGGFKCFRRWVLESLDLSDVHAGGYAFQIELTYRAMRMGARVVEVPIVFTDRSLGELEDEPGHRLEAVWKVPWLRLRALRGQLGERPAGIRGRRWYPNHQQWSVQLESGGKPPSEPRWSARRSSPEPSPGWPSTTPRTPRLGATTPSDNGWVRQSQPQITMHVDNASNLESYTVDLDGVERDQPGAAVGRPADRGRAFRSTMGSTPSSSRPTRAACSAATSHGRSRSRSTRRRRSWRSASASTATSTATTSRSPAPATRAPR